VLELRTAAGRHRSLSAAIAVLLAIQLVVLAGDRGDDDEPTTAERAAQVVDPAVGQADAAGGPEDTTTAPAPPGTEAPTTTATKAVLGNGTGRRPATSTTQPPPPVNPPARGCGDTIRKADGTAWVCTWADDFDGTELDATHWSPLLTKDTDFNTGGECMVDRPQNLHVADGALHLVAIHELRAFTCESNAPRKNYPSQVTSAMVTTLGKWEQALGRFEVRAKLPDARTPGVGASFWLWPHDPLKYGPWPGSGEIDFMEWYSHYPELIIPFFHYIAPDGTARQTTYKCKLANVSDWHTYALEWTQDTLSAFVDGAACLVDKWNALLLQSPAPFDQPFSLSLTQGVGPGRDYRPGVTKMPAETTVDYVRVWR
jgi:beta-glucanase (GH16 family)